MIGRRARRVSGDHVSVLWTLALRDALGSFAGETG